MSKILNAHIWAYANETIVILIEINFDVQHLHQYAWNTLIAFNKNMINPIILATEPYSNTNKIIPKINQDLSAHYCSNGTLKSRAAILIHKNLDQVAIHIKHKDREIIFASIYMDITHDIPPTQSIPLINYENNNKLPLIIGSDTNAQHTLWGNRECNKRGKDLIDLFNSLGLSWANKGSTPTFINSRGHESIIDLTITNSFVSDLIKKWKVDLSFSNSDHRYITVNIDSKHHNNPRQVKLTKNTDWDIFDEYLTINPTSDINTNNITTTKDLDTAATKLNEHLLKAFNNAFPLTIQKACHHIHKTARNIMIKSHEMQHVPGSWTESNGIFLPKPGKTDYKKPNSYRTITLSLNSKRRSYCCTCIMT